MLKWCALTLSASAVAVASLPAPLDTVANFKSWKRLTAKPALMPDYVATMCSARIDPKLMADPHKGNLIHVYVNPTGEKEATRAYASVKAGKVPKKVSFPEGTVIVKSKFGDLDMVGKTKHPVKAAQIELLTVMVKLGKGKSPKTGDWRFAVMDGAGKKVLDDKRQAMCWSCHKDMPADHVSFDYRLK